MMIETKWNHSNIWSPSLSESILWNSMTSTSFVFTELANTMKFWGGFLYNFVFTEWRHCVSKKEVWGRGCYITLFSPSDVTAFHTRICIVRYIFSFVTIGRASVSVSVHHHPLLFGSLIVSTRWELSDSVPLCVQHALPPTCGSLYMFFTTAGASPDGSFVSTGACNLGVPGSNPGRDGYLSSWLCIYRAPNCSKAWSV